MPFYKVTVQMQQFNRGWKYIWYLEAQTARQAINVFYGIRSAFATVHDAGAIVRSIHAANVDRRDHDLRDINIAGGGGAAGGPSGFAPDADVSTTAAQIRFFTEGNAHRLMWLRGIADSAVVRNPNGQSTPLAIWKTRLTTLIGRLHGVQARIRVQNDPTVENFGWHDVSSVEAATGFGPEGTHTTIRLSGDVAEELDKNTRVTFQYDKRDAALLGFKGTHRIIAAETSLNTKAITIAIKYRGPSAGVYSPPTPMRVRQVGYTYQPLRTPARNASGAISEPAGEFVRFGSKKTGPAPAPAGRDASVSWRHD